MNKKASMMTLLIVALVALGLMAFVSLNNVTGDAVGPVKIPKISPKPGPAGPSPVPPKPVIVNRGPDTVVVNDKDDVVYEYPSDIATQTAVLENTIVTCDVARAMGVQDKLSQRTISICQNLLYPFI